MSRQAPSKPTSRRTVVLTVCSILVFLVGLAILLYPTVSDQWNRYRQSRLITEYVEQVDMVPEDSMETYWERAWAYNRSLSPIVLPDSFAVAAASETPGSEYMACLNLNGDGMMGYVSIPKINVKLPIYHTTSDQVLQLGAGHLEGSSLPVGGASTHAVLAAHRGLPSAKMFTDLDQLEEGDHFLLYILDDVLCYEVDKINIVEPEDTQDLSVEQGEDLVTLLTCTPYGVNTQRLLVRGHRVPYDESVITKENRGIAQGIRSIPVWTWAICGGAAAILVILVLYSFLRQKNGRRGRHES